MSTGFDERKFESKVLDAVSDLTQIGFGDYKFGVAAALAFPQPFNWLRRLTLRWFGGKGPEEIKQELEQAAAIVQRQAFEPAGIFEKPRLRDSIRSALCPALKCLSGDAFEIAKVSTPILLSLSLAGTISLPAQPLVFGMIAVIIARSGVAAACGDSGKDSPEKK